MFGAVTTDTGKAKIVKDGSSASGTWDNVVNMHPHNDTRLRLTILAKPASALGNAISQTNRNVGHKSCADLKMIANVVPAPLKQEERL